MNSSGKDSSLRASECNGAAVSAETSKAAEILSCDVPDSPFGVDGNKIVGVAPNFIPGLVASGDLAAGPDEPPKCFTILGQEALSLR